MLGTAIPPAPGTGADRQLGFRCGSMESAEAREGKRPAKILTFKKETTKLCIKKIEKRAVLYLNKGSIAYVI